jgi:hypothetical protein
VLDHVEDKSAEPLLEVRVIALHQMITFLRTDLFVNFSSSFGLPYESRVANVELLPCRGYWRLELNYALCSLNHLNA